MDHTTDKPTVSLITVFRIKLTAICILRFLSDDTLRFLYGVCRDLREVALRELTRRAGGSKPRLSYTEQALYSSPATMESSPNYLKRAFKGRRRLQDGRIYLAYGHMQTHVWLMERCPEYIHYSFATRCITACTYGYLEWLQANAIKLNSNIVGGTGMYHTACVNGHLKVVQWLHQTFKGRFEKDPFNQIQTVFQQTAGNGKLDVAQWLHAKYEFTREEAVLDGRVFQMACSHGFLDILQWLHATFNITRDEAAPYIRSELRSVCVENRLEMAQWLHNTFTITREEMPDYYKTFGPICGNGHLEMARWFHATFEIARNEYRAANRDLFQAACRDGYLDLAMWLHATFTFTREEVMCYSFPHGVCANNCLEVMQWASSTFALTRDHLSATQISKMFQSACVYGHLRMAQWLQTTYTVTRDEALKLSGHLFGAVCLHGRLEVVQWLHATFTFTQEEVTSDRCKVLRDTCVLGNLDVAQWLYGNFTITREEFMTGRGRECVLDAICGNSDLKMVQWVHAAFAITREDAEGIGAFSEGHRHAKNPVILWLHDTFK